MSARITVTLRRSDLVRAEACDGGLALFDAIAEAQGGVWVRPRGCSEARVCRTDRVRVRWTPLAQVWLASTYPDFARWLYRNGLVPMLSLAGADLGGAYLRGADLRGAYLGGADLGGAYLRGADLGGAYLGGAYLRGADLRGAYLGGAYLRGADLRGADLGGAYLRGAQRNAWDTRVDGWRVESGVMVRDAAAAVSR